MISITKSSFGFYTDPDNPTTPIEVFAYDITNNANGFSAQVIEYGATLTKLIVPNRDGQLKDVVLGFDDLQSYLTSDGYFGGTIGRVCNRIKGGRFILAGQVVQLDTNNGENHLHGGFRGFDKRHFKSEIVGNDKVVFSRISADGEERYPNAVLVQVSYSITPENELVMEYRGMCDKTTVLSMTNHAYFNLNGHEQSGDRLAGHQLQILASQYTEVDEGLAITGNLIDVQGSTFDFRQTKNLNALLLQGELYDHNFCLDEATGQDYVVRMSVPNLTMELSTSKVLGVQFYSGNFLPQEEPYVEGKGGAQYQWQGAFCMELQAWPDAVNQPTFPSVVLRPGEIYEKKDVFRFY
jgi:aldose 1-epimerase